MCLAIVAETVFPSWDILQAGEEQNKNGGGIAWIENGLVRWKKSISAKEMWALKDRIKPPILAHFRQATYGGDSPRLCHPFGVSPLAEAELEGTAKQILIHNGSWASWDKMILNSLDYKSPLIPDGPWSDTRGIAFLAFRYGLNFLAILDEKVATMNGSGKIEIFAPNRWSKVGELILSYDPLARAGYRQTQNWSNQWKSNVSTSSTSPVQDARCKVCDKYTLWCPPEHKLCTFTNIPRSRCTCTNCLNSGNNLIPIQDAIALREETKKVQTPLMIY